MCGVACSLGRERARSALVVVGVIKVSFLFFFLSFISFLTKAIRRFEQLPQLLISLLQNSNISLLPQELKITC